MFDYKGRLITQNVTSNDTVISDEAIAEIVEKQPNLPVRINFTGDPIGETKSFEFSDGILSCTFSIKYPNMDELKLAVVPQGLVNLNGYHVDDRGVIMIDKFQLTEVSLTSSPADPTLGSIKSLD